MVEYDRRRTRGASARWRCLIERGTPCEPPPATLCAAQVLGGPSVLRSARSRRRGCGSTSVGSPRPDRSAGMAGASPRPAVPVEGPAGCAPVLPGPPGSLRPPRRAAAGAHWAAAAGRQRRVRGGGGGAAARPRGRLRRRAAARSSWSRGPVPFERLPSRRRRGSGPRLVTRPARFVDVELGDRRHAARATGRQRGRDGRLHDRRQPARGEPCSRWPPTAARTTTRSGTSRCTTRCRRARTSTPTPTASRRRAAPSPPRRVACP